VVMDPGSRFAWPGRQQKNRPVHDGDKEDTP
jgi:hypothetical protein